MPTPEPTLTRTLGLRAVVLFGLAYMTPLIVLGIFGIIAETTAGATPSAYLLALGAMLFTAYSYGRMVVVHPVAGSAYTYASHAFGRPLGFMIGWALLLDYNFLPMINYLVIGLYMQDYFPSTPQALWVVIGVVLVTGLNILGVKLLARMNFIFIAAQVVFIAVFVAVSVAKLGGGAGEHSLSAPFVGSDLNMSLVLAGAAILALSFLGFDAVSTLSEETRDPRRRIPRAILLCALFGGLVYILQAYLAQLVFPRWQTLVGREDVASADVMKFVGGGSLNSFFTAVYVSSAFACAMASQASVARILYAMGRDGSLPRPVFGWLHSRFRTPVVANLVVGAIGLTALFISLTTVSSMISFGALAAFSFVNLAVIKTYVLDRGERSAAAMVKYGLLPFLGFAFTLYLWTQLTRLTFEIGLSWVAVGFLYLLYLTRMFRRRPPAMYTGEEEDQSPAGAPARA
jgi:putrescine importer